LIDAAADTEERREVAGDERREDRERRRFTRYVTVPPLSSS
jgi:hypothetical protein